MNEDGKIPPLMAPAAPQAAEWFDALEAAWTGCLAESRYEDLRTRHLATLPPLALAAAQGEPKFGWISVKQSDPKSYGRVLVLTTDVDGDPMPVIARWNGPTLGFLGLGGKKVKPATHWAPIPAADQMAQPTPPAAPEGERTC